MPRALVIGAGFGGMAAALRLRAKGYEVTILDKQDQLGGRAYQYRRDTLLGTFVHDAGPTVITAAFLIDELYALFGKHREDYVKLVDLYPWYRIQFADGSQFNYGGTLEQSEAEIRKIDPNAIEGFHKFLEHSRRIFDVGFTQLGAVPFHRLSSMLKCLPAMIRLQSYRSVWSLASKYFKNEKLRRIFSFQPLLVGGNPFTTTSIYSLIFYLERQWGLQFVMGGTGALVAGLERLMHEQGIEIRLGSEVTGIVPKSAAGGGEKFMVNLKHGAPLPADLLVCNADAPAVWTHLIPPKYRTMKSRFWLPRLKYSMGLFVLYFGTSRKFPGVAHHTIVLGESYKELLKRMFDRFELETKDLSIYLHRPTATDPSMAPKGCDSFYCLVPVPNLQAKIDWAEWGPKLRLATIEYLERTALPGLTECIVDDFFVTPEHFQKNLNTLHGTGFSIQPLLSQSAWFRFHNKAPGIDGLYLVGAGTHPGAGVPGVLCSAKVLDQLVPAVGQSASARPAL